MLYPFLQVSVGKHLEPGKHGERLGARWGREIPGIGSEFKGYFRLSLGQTCIEERSIWKGTVASR